MKIVKVPFAALLAGSLAVSAVPAAYAAPVTSYTGDFMPTSSDTSPVLKPLWTADAKVGLARNIDAFQAKTLGGFVFYPGKDKLSAVDAASGRQKWSIRAKLNSDLVADGNALYYVDRTGSLIKTDAKTGRTVWKNKAGLKSQFGGFSAAMAGGRLYVSGSESLQAFDPATGKRIWKQSSESDLAGTVHGVYDGVLIASFVVSGAITIDQYVGFDPKTGKKLWQLGDSHGPILDVQGGSLYLQNTSQWGNEENYAAVLDKISLKTGKKVSSFGYIPVEDALFQQASRLIVDGKFVYVSVRKYTPGTLGGGPETVYRFNANQEPSAQKPVMYEGYGDLLAGPYMDRLFFQNGLQLTYMKFAGQASSSYPDIYNPISRLDLHGSGAYVGLSDGNFYTVDLPSAKTVGRIDTGARVYGETLFSDSIVIVQAENKLIAFKRPSALKD
ncbi:outer membrane protein assembly factor BamB family protein [Saccharibacillus alkalitolerans]|uniref:PQQ-binding-like beta-propeller repeat protein n=1 Tax=Saccharibacillus alkalitolerans TaxID=2705290 RepID=A0ABX0F9C2_9BACL|nr:PQQ-binding-like beta-propeller repeat protein [Saccharibacillus alkalitolerans]NGZ74607.1 PQQ-binding-like beta-propeller repeat protein [Saccharibacillus alkalitolerans]